MRKFDFDSVESVYFSLWNSYHPEQTGGEENFEIDFTFMSIWHLYLRTSGWTEDEFFEEMDNRVEECDCDKQESLNKEVN